MDPEPVDAFYGTPFSECDGRTVQFAWEGQEYEIDLSAQHAREFATEVAPYIKAGRPRS